MFGQKKKPEANHKGEPIKYTDQLPVGMNVEENGVVYVGTNEKYFKAK